MKHSAFDVLEQRGYIYQATHLDRINKMLNCEPTTFYLGIDPTADSLHIGHFFALMMFRHLQDAGHKGILVIGGATALVGDPSGKSDLRKMLTKEEVSRNLEEVKTLAKRFIVTDGENPAIILDNAEWINKYSYIDFMRGIGIHFNVNRMLGADSYSKRLEEGGLTFLEMGYMPMQAFDFVHLNKTYGCKLQIGGSDQWGNIVAGINLGRKLKHLDESKENCEEDMFGLTCPLLMTKEGKKMGKTERGTLWVAREKTTVFDFYQYFYNVRDEDTEMLLRLFTTVPIEQIVDLCDNDMVGAKKRMAFEITKLVHGEEANGVLAAVDALFGAGVDLDTVPCFKLDKSLLEEGINIIDLLSGTHFISSKSEARRVVQQGGITVNNSKIADINYIAGVNDIENDYILLKRGKKNFLKVTF
jgi:tyrosyl-tRNA synthetase